MKQLMRRFSRVADSSHYHLLHTDSQPTPRRPGLSRNLGRCLSTVRAAAVPQGHVPVYVGVEMERFVISAELINHPLFAKLLNKSAQEYGYEQKGVLRIPCHVLVFERVLEAHRLGNFDSRDLQDLLSSPSSDDFL